MSLDIERVKRLEIQMEEEYSYFQKESTNYDDYDNEVIQYIARVATGLENTKIYLEGLRNEYYSAQKRAS